MHPINQLCDAPRPVSLAWLPSHFLPRRSSAVGLTTLHYRGQRDTAQVHLTPGHASLLHLLKPSRPMSSSVHFSLRGKRVLIWMASCCLFPISRLLAHVTASSRRTHQGPRVSTLAGACWRSVRGLTLYISLIPRPLFPLHSPPSFR